MKRSTGKIVLIVMIVALVALFCVSASAANISLVFKETAVDEDGVEATVVVDVVLSENTGLAGLHLLIAYDDALTANSVTAGDALSKLDFICSNDLTANPLTLGWDSLDVNDISNGTVASITFTVPLDVVTDYIVLGFVADAYDRDLNDVDVSVEDLKITVFKEENIPEINYPDVSKDAWYYSYVEKATYLGLMNGVSGGRFAPDDTLSRAMLATILYRVAGSPEVTFKPTFTDVKESDWFAKAVIWAADNGIVNGVGTGLFAPNDNVTREQMTTMFYRYASFAKADITVTEDKTAAFTDAEKVSSWAKDGFKWALEKGIVNGTTQTTLSPADTATRAQATAVIVRFIELLK